MKKNTRLLIVALVIVGVLTLCGCGTIRILPDVRFGRQEPQPRVPVMVIKKEGVRNALSGTDKRVLITTQATRSLGMAGLVRQELMNCGFVPVGDVVQKTSLALFFGDKKQPPHELEVEINFRHVSGYGWYNSLWQDRSAWSGEATLFSGDAAVAVGRAEVFYYLSEQRHTAAEEVVSKTLQALCYYRVSGGGGESMGAGNARHMESNPAVCVSPTCYESQTTIGISGTYGGQGIESGGAPLKDVSGQRIDGRGNIVPRRGR